MKQAIDIELVSKIESAAEKALTRLFAEHNESFYYITLVTFGECVCPFISAWSFEALEKEAEKSENAEQAKYDLKWDYAASPYCSFGYEGFFGELREVYELRTSRLADNDDAYETEMEIRMNSMEQAMHNLDQKGLFGQGEKRLGTVINAEYMPPDNEDVERAKRLNPEAALKEWLEVFEKDEEEPKKIDWYEIHNPDLCKIILTKSIDDKRLAIRLRRDFASPLTLSDFLKCCSKIPFEIRSDFVFKKAKQIIENNQDYKEFISIELTGNKK